ncbi:hypothetical protein BBB39_09215 [Bordetella trematum]|uniref:Phage protein n=1 Tax=Bordetella trematum TaxID=123899 RepID=A0A157QBS5_9BORD|nr:phage tail assembly chaperone [Bordetella trematum]AZR93930.1 hypothetical protein BBB39_09215 [Bordetella trematum]NNH19062.1 hypothetical protein [Bordetella trematum]SAI43088.1 phage protein [Bordetella trematum]SAI72234.1 phage protein [Bordetella trematum]SUV97920.1 phage protein [Bordetella trematum]
MSKVTFNLQASPTFTVPVEIPRHGEDPATIKVTFKHKTREGLDDFLRRASRSTADQDFDLCSEILDSWEGPDMPFGKEAFDLLVDNYQGAMRALVSTYTAELLQARRKN